MTLQKKGSYIHRGTSGDTATVSANYCGPKVRLCLEIGPFLTYPYYDLLMTKQKGTGLRAVATPTLPSPGEEWGKGFAIVMKIYVQEITRTLIIRMKNSSW